MPELTIIDSDLYWDEVYDTMKPGLMVEECMCRATGFINVFSEMSALIYTALFSSLLKRLVQDPTGSFSKLSGKIHIISLVVPALVCIIESLTLRFGVSVRDLC